MEKLKLDYYQPPPPTPPNFDWESLFRFFFLGPFSGALVGLVQTIAAVMVWEQFSEPDFYFRGWSGARFDLILCTIGGALVGVPYGLLLLVFEKSTGKRVRMMVIPALGCLSFLLSILIVWWQFQQHALVFAFFSQAISVVLGFVMSFASARCVPNA